MRYSQRFTERVCFPEDEIDEKVSYLSRVTDKNGEIVLHRLGLYEDLGFSPAELAQMLLELDLNADQMERIKIAQKRINAFDKKGYYFAEFEG